MNAEKEGSFHLLGRSVPFQKLFYSIAGKASFNYGI